VSGELKCYEVPVREVFERTVYVNATSEREARRMALNTVNWVDADDPMGGGEIRGTRDPVSVVGDPL
jgi:hypothetical protein